ncbi:MAG TPA: hypothetical protein VF930_12215 [Stellaceae bacterium]
MPRICEVVAGLALLLLWGAPAQAQDQVVDERLDASMSAPLHNPHFDILVVTVVAIENGAFTSENPPQGLVRVDDSLRGDETAGTIYPARWSGHIRADDYEDQGGVRNGTWIPPRIKPEWGQRPLVPPRPGDRVIVFAAGVAEFKSIWAQAAFRFSPENRDFAVAHMASAERSAAIQTPAFLLIVLTPVACVILHICSRSTAASERARSRVRLALWLALFLVPGLYAFYESGISIHTNIRVDLLLLWPAIALTMAIAAASLLSERRSAQA